MDTRRRASLFGVMVCVILSIRCVTENALGKDELLANGVDLVKRIEASKKADGTYPKSLDLGTKSNCEFEYEVGSDGLMYTVRVRSGGHNWLYSKFFKTWVYDLGEDSD